MLVVKADWGEEGDLSLLICTHLILLKFICGGGADSILSWHARALMLMSAL